MSIHFGSWVRRQSLGKGGFGCVWLWINEETDEKLAIKECQVSFTTEKMRKWWKAEVEIMGKLQHDNLVRAMPIPQEFVFDPSQPPVLAMEFCEGGDLRKVLNLPQNCFGLTQTEIRQLGSGIAGALDYLHHHRITHRDLKPENIVLQPEGTRTFYKIIDLGYAKELDMNSLCNSFVGTEKYLAPELFVAKPYTKTVDYWSFGVVMFESVTGYRPFLPHAPPVVWHPTVSKKSPDDICAYYNDKSEVIFTRNLPDTTHLLKPLCRGLEQWLRRMLRWHPKQRGGNTNCFRDLQNLMSQELFTVLDVENNKLLSYAVTPDHLVYIEKIMEIIEKETEIPVREQCLVLASGQRLHAGDYTAQNTTQDQYSDEVKIFLFRAGPMQRHQRKTGNLPSNVNVIVKEPSVLLAPKDHRRAWAEAVYWFTEESNNYHQLTLAHRAAILNLLHDNSALLKQKYELDTEVCQLVTIKDFFKTSLEFDINKCKETMEDSRQLSQAGGPMFAENWSTTASNLEIIDKLVDKTKILKERITSINTAVQELQKKPGIQSNELKEFEKNAKEMYEEFVKAIQANGQEIIEHQGMVHLIAKCFLRRDELIENLYTHLSSVRELQSKLEPIFKHLEEARVDVRDRKEQLRTLQTQRQQTLWSIIRNPQQEQLISQPELPCEIPHGFSSGQYSMMPDLESIQLMTDCRQYTQRTKSIMAEMLREQEEQIGYFSSLESNK